MADVKQMSVKALVTRFQRAALSDDPWDTTAAVVVELLRRGERDALLQLVHDAADIVRGWAAVHALHFAPEDGERVLVALAHGHDVIGAGVVLREWREGLSRPPTMGKRDWMQRREEHYRESRSTQAPRVPAPAREAEAAAAGTEGNRQGLRIRDIRLSDVLAGKNWRLMPTADVDENMTSWLIEECEQFSLNDQVVYSALSVTISDRVIPVLVVREVGSAGWWGDCCELVDGRWQQVGLVPDPDAETSQEFVANPPPNDPSFGGGCGPEQMRDGFRRWRSRLALGSA
jgi:hypothetical protein